MTAVILFLLAIVLAVWLVWKKYSAISQEASASSLGMWIMSKTFRRILIIPVLLMLFAMINPFKLQRVDAGHVGIKFNLTGDKRGISRYEYKSGWIIFNSWFSKLYEFPTYQQHIDYDSQSVITKGGFPATIKPSFNYSLKPGDVGDMFQNLRLSIKELEKQWLHIAIVGAINDVANVWTVDSIFNYRTQFEANIVAESNHRVEKWFTISQLRTNITPPLALVESIDKKTRAIQDVQVAENQKLVAQADAQRKIAQAKGDSAQLVINASGEAEAMRRKVITLTPEYVEYMKIEKWNGVLPQVQSGSNGGILMNLGKQ